MLTSDQQKLINEISDHMKKNMKYVFDYDETTLKIFKEKTSEILGCKPENIVLEGVILNNTGSN